MTGPDDRADERTGFQESRPYHPSIDLGTDVAMVYGIDETMPRRVEQWRAAGYRVHLMTGVAWGQYQDYLDGAHDGREHWDEAQTGRDGEPIWHGGDPRGRVPYMVPTLSYADYLIERIRPAVDAGVDAIHLEEPEFWDVAGYSGAFKREWQIYYKRPWQPPDSSPDARYKASKLKQYLYTRCLDRLCAALKDYALTRYGRQVRFYVPTHSLINYTQWRIVSPQSRLLELPTCDGYIAQIWTGTSRTPNVYAGERKERTFETAYLEYGIMQELVRGTDRRMWFLHDPIEDNPRYTWEDYRRNYQCTLVASLLHPAIWRYEVVPWPNRVFNGRYRREDTGAGRGDIGAKREGGDAKEAIPPTYATELLIAMNALRDMKQEDVSEEHEAPRIGLLLADSAMFQRWAPDGRQPNKRYDGTDNWADQGAAALEALNWSPFYGLALPLLKEGQDIRPVQLDNVRRFPGYLDDYDVLLLSYEFMKPASPDLHDALAGWVRRGKGLVYLGDGSDPYHGVEEWWNSGATRHATPADHLCQTLGIDAGSEAIQRVGEGVVRVVRRHPAAFAQSPQAAEELRGIVRDVAAALGQTVATRNRLALYRGPYLVGHVLDESASSEPWVVRGRFIDLLDSGLPLVTERAVAPGEQVWLLDLDRVPGTEPRVLTSAARVRDKDVAPGRFAFTAATPAGVEACLVIRLPRRPREVRIDGHAVNPSAYVAEAGLVWLRYAGTPHGTRMEISY